MLDLERQLPVTPVAERCEDPSDTPCISSFPDANHHCGLTRADGEAEEVERLGSERPVLPELQGVLQRWIDHETNDARMVVAVAGSRLRLMRGLRTRSPGTPG